ncbi:hypothetical protein P153DRAFT_362593 [Dothidotthia symphoricarpi CBS 119687]|uniref:F-box domain-containing protein n=1 Tax=Dothidotthia symphoricarpi CBS 119687 TaxID=1392245 RepID=A0A6A6AT79_9PLEO|nr:uncharacterized protein P153DRAFT_362593 [Dothidotthia symphoricarpi CBS 119687]KAF2134870.1 hypothetical protein P153DRAFT_362593 [Dothidotthia symphoricarpi CBS 119687]
MDPDGPRSFLRPRRVNQKACFTVADAGQLMLKLQALDETLRLTPFEDHPKLDLESIDVASGTYVIGSEDLFQVVKGISCAGLIPDVYIEAYRTMLQRRPYLNHFRKSDINKGYDPTFSEVRRILADIDALCGTELYGYIQKLDRDVKPFAFLRLPAELRLQVYSHLLPREAHIALLYTPHRNHQLSRLNLDILRVSHQLYDECVKYFYENRTLWMMAGRDQTGTLTDEYVGRAYETLAVMNTQTRLLFKRLEIMVQVWLLPPANIPASRRHYGIPPVSEPMRQIFALLPNLETVLFSFNPVKNSMFERGMPRVYRMREDILLWVLDSMPEPAPRIQWDISRSSPFWNDEHERVLRPKLEERTGMEMGESVLSRLGCLK